MVCNEFTCDANDITYFIDQYFGRALSTFEISKLHGMRQIAYCYLAIHFLEHAIHAGLSLSENYPIDTVPTVNEWIESFEIGKYKLYNANDFLLYAYTKIKESNSQIGL